MRGIKLLVLLLAIAAGIFGSARSSARLLSIEEMPDVGEMCEWPPAAAEPQPTNLFAAFQDSPVYAASQDLTSTNEVNRPPERYIRDTDPIYSSVAVDTRLNEVYLQDPNTWSIRVFNRLENTAAAAERSQPKRVIVGPKTELQFNSCVY